MHLLFSEIATLANLRHKNIVHYVTSWIEEKQTRKKSPSNPEPISKK